MLGNFLADTEYHNFKMHFTAAFIQHFEHDLTPDETILFLKILPKRTRYKKVGVTEKGI